MLRGQGGEWRLMSSLVAVHSRPCRIQECAYCDSAYNGLKFLAGKIAWLYPRSAMLRDRRIVFATVATIVGILLLVFHLEYFDDARVLTKVGISEPAAEEVKPVDTKPVDTKPVDTKPVDAKPVDTKPSDDDYVMMEPSDESVKIVLFPQSYASTDLRKEYTTITSKVLHEKSAIGKFDGNRSSKDALSGSKFSPYFMDIFNTFQFIEGDMDKCSIIHDKISVEVSTPTNLKVSLEEVILEFRKNQPEYFKDIEGFFNDENNIDDLIKKGTFNDHWYRIAGSSVFLEQYGLNYMVSRIFFSPSGIRDKPVFSFLMAQVYDLNWNELRNAELIVPTNNPDIHQETPIMFKAKKYPCILPIPFYFNPTYTQDRYYGPEDPRLILVKNPNGYEEPLIIFNQEHRKVKEYNQLKENELAINFKRHRSMFIGWPWQYQRGKNIADVISSNPSWDESLYTRIVELKKENKDRANTEKNWTPMLSSKDLETYNHDKYIYLVYKWSHLEILKCPLSSISSPLISECTTVYKMPTDGDVGDFRGGTEMVNVKSLLKKFNSAKFNKALSHIPNKLNIWIGFARAHIKCACAESMYRPNLAIITERDGKYKISHTSSFSSFNIPLINWAADSTGLCDGRSVVIPNSISDWVVEGDDDYLTLTYSVADSTIENIHIKGLLTALLNAKTTSSNLLFTPNFSGFDNENVDCAIKASHDFCAAFKEQVDKDEEKAGTKIAAGENN